MDRPGPLRRSIATVSLSGTLEEKIHAVALAGFDGIELFEADLVGCPWSPREVRARCEDAGLRIELYQPVRDLEAVPRARHRQAVERARAKIALAATLGAPVVLACSNVGGDTVDDDKLAAEDLRELGVIGADHGVRIAYEALSWGRFVNTLARAWRVVEAAGHESVGVCVDSFHVLSVGDTGDGLAGVDPDRLLFLQLADAPYVAMDLLQWSRHHRCFPGQGSFDLVDFTLRVLAAGYEGPLSLEIFNDVIRWSDPLMTAVDAMRSLLALEDGMHRVAPAAGHSARVPPERLRSLPEGSPPSHIASAGLGGDAGVALGIEQMLGAMGFRDERVEGRWTERRWRSGGARVTVRRDPSGGGDPVIGELALACPAPAAAAARARALLVETRPTGTPAVEELRAPDGRRIELCPEAYDESSPQGHLRAIDHAVLTLADDEFEESMLFFRSVLSLQAQASEELASPDGLVRSRALASAGRDGSCAAVRVALNASGSRAGRGHLREREHLAFSCQDIVAVASSWRDAGVPLLDVPDNYYEDLTARLGLDGAVLEDLWRLGLLYDRDAAGNEFLHCYTEAVGGRFFFELVQRNGGYDGYGAVNTGVRMSAQRWKERAVAVR